jgi:hypothetical protein
VKRRAALLALLLTAFARPSSAQVLFDVGAVFVGGSSSGASAANYTAPDGSLVPQFSIDRSIRPAIGVNSHLTIHVSSRVSLEATALWARPQLRTKLGGDSDGADNATATQSIDRFELGGGASLALKQFGRWHSFARASVAWLRELSDDQSLYQDGWDAQLGGGANFQWTEKRGRFRPYGVRTEAWLDIRHGGIPFSAKPRMFSPAFSAAMIFKL